MNRADPHNLRDGTGWGAVDLVSGRETVHHTLWRNTNRTIAFDEEEGRPVDTKYQDPGNRIPPQDHY
nr:serine/threonine protein phosphatase [Gammaproteobacteria bacterium]